MYKTILILLLGTVAIVSVAAVGFYFAAGDSAVLTEEAGMGPNPHRVQLQFDNLAVRAHLPKC